MIELNAVKESLNQGNLIQGEELASNKKQFKTKGKEA